MARGDWTAGQQRIAVTVPIPLVKLIEKVQEQHCFDSKSMTIRFLIETHPALAEILDDLYAKAQQIHPS